MQREPQVCVSTLGLFLSIESAFENQRFRAKKIVRPDQMHLDRERLKHIAKSFANVRFVSGDLWSGDYYICVPVLCCGLVFEWLRHCFALLKAWGGWFLTVPEKDVYALWVFVPLVRQSFSHITIISYDYWIFIIRLFSSFTRLLSLL